ncbi:hypothetical protein WN51_03944 [Melipona quadrifasciata]|uniref:Uncharacterized protein n=1 Tax=Melipona quadrifasciata TaxID=166423 RepID=A0A0N0U311_9HYME|nr:hypothetical protein WN51_03944 [Melipona quadrifasciata]
MGSGGYISVVTVGATVILLVDDRNDRNGLNQKQPGLVGGVNDRLFKPGRCGSSLWIDDSEVVAPLVNRDDRQWRPPDSFKLNHFSPINLTLEPPSTTKPNKFISPSSTKIATDKSRTKPGNNVLMIRSMQLPPTRRGKQGDSRGTNEFPWNLRANTLARCRSWKLGLGGRGPGILGALNKVALQPGSTPQRSAETRTPRLEIASEFSAKRTEEFHAIFIIRERRLNSTVSGRPAWDREAWFVWNSASFSTQQPSPSSLSRQLSRKRGDYARFETNGWCNCVRGKLTISLTMAELDRKLEWNSIRL